MSEETDLITKPQGICIQVIIEINDKISVKWNMWKCKCTQNVKENKQPKYTQHIRSCGFILA